MDPLEWLARMSDRIPDPGQHRTLFYGEYTNRVRGEGQPPESDTPSLSAEPPRKRCSPSWARLIAKVYQVDPLLCLRCGKRMAVVAFVTDAFAIRKILDHLGLSTPEAEKPAPLREVLRVALELGAAYAFDRESYARFYPLASRRGFQYRQRTLTTHATKGRGSSR